MRHLAGTILGVVMVLVVPSLAATDDEPMAVPPGFEPFEQMVGGWKGQGIPAKNRLKGWPERHSWSWKFAKGKPIAMTVETTKGKILSKALLTRDEKAGIFRLDGTDPEGKAVAFAGKFDDSVGMLSLTRENPPADVGRERIDIAINENKIRYSMRLFRQEPDAPQFALVIDANMGKDGESFAAGGAADDVPKCIVTGGAGTMTVSFDGKSFPICCSGCRDEFNESPEKYVKKYLARVQSGSTGASKPADAPVAAPSDPAKPATSNSPAKTETEPRKTAKPATPKGNDVAAKAANLLTLGRSLEKAGKNQAALIYFKRIVKEYPDTPAAVTAKARIKALGG